MNELCMQLCAMQFDDANTALYHHGIMGMKWGVRRYQPYGAGGYDPDHIGKNTGLAARIAKGLGGLSGGLREAGERARFGTHKLGGAIDRGLLKAKRKGSSALSTLSAIGNTDVRDIGRMAKQKGSSALSALSTIGNTDVRNISRMAKRKVSDLRGMSQSGELERMLRSGLSQMGAKAATAGRDAAFGASILTSMIGGAKPGSALDRVNSRYGSSSGKETSRVEFPSTLSEIRQYPGRKATGVLPSVSRDVLGQIKEKAYYDDRYTNLAKALDRASVNLSTDQYTTIRKLMNTPTTRVGREALDGLGSLAIPPALLYNASVGNEAYELGRTKTAKGQGRHIGNLMDTLTNL